MFKTKHWFHHFLNIKSQIKLISIWKEKKFKNLITFQNMFLRFHTSNNKKTTKIDNKNELSILFDRHIWKSNYLSLVINLPKEFSLKLIFFFHVKKKQVFFAYRLCFCMYLSEEYLYQVSWSALFVVARN